ncbi:MAG: hypothetical protein OEY56_02115 [Cyclobacteriaceae bacterium]|nr:hypothetical protein [Cyclobacteriaceae bacterium]
MGSTQAIARSTGVQLPKGQPRLLRLVGSACTSLGLSSFYLATGHHCHRTNGI